MLVGDGDAVRSLKGWEVLHRERLRLTCRVRHRYITWESNLQNFRDEIS